MVSLMKLCFGFNLVVRGSCWRSTSFTLSKTISFTVQFHSPSHIICGIKQFMGFWNIYKSRFLRGQRDSITLVSEGAADGCVLKPSSRRPQNTNSFIRYPNRCKSGCHRSNRSCYPASCQSKRLASSASCDIYAHCEEQPKK